MRIYPLNFDFSNKEPIFMFKVGYTYKSKYFEVKIQQRTSGFVFIDSKQYKIFRTLNYEYIYFKKTFISSVNIVNNNKILN